MPANSSAHDFVAAWIRICLAGVSTSVVAVRATRCADCSYALLEAPVHMPARRVACKALVNTKYIQRSPLLREQEGLLAQRQLAVLVHFLQCSLRVPPRLNKT